MRKMLLIAAIWMMIFTGCTKEDNADCSMGKLRYTNTSNNRYTIYLDGASKGNLSGNKFIEYDVTKGSHSIKAVQFEGYVLYPTIRETNVTIQGCDNKEFIFP